MEAELSYNLEKLDRLWGALDAKARRRICMRALRRAAVPLQRQAQQRWAQTGIANAAKLKRHIRLRMHARWSGFTVTIKGRGTGRAQRQSNGRYGYADQGYLLRFFEGGTYDRRTRRGQRRGSIRAYQFMQKTKDSSQTEALARRTGSEIVEAMAAEARRYGVTID